MNILSTQQMKQIEIQLLKMPLPPTFQLKPPKMTQSGATASRQANILPLASQNTQQEIRKVVSLAENIRCISLSDPNSILKVFTMAILTMIYQGRDRSVETSDSQLLEALKCSLYSPDVVLNSIKGTPINQNSNQMKALIASFFAFMSSQRQKLTTDVFKMAQATLLDNQQLLACFIVFFRCILVTLEVQGAGNWKGGMNECASLEHLLDYFDLSYRQIGDLFLLYEQGVLLSVREKEVVYGQYFENQRDRKNQMEQLEIKQSIKFNMIQSYLVNVNSQQAARKKKGIVDSDLKLFNFMLESQEEVKSHPDTETPHFSDNETFHFGKKKKEDQTVSYRPQEVRFEFEKLIKDESLQDIEPDDLINFNAQFDDSPSLGGGQFNLKYEKNIDSPSSLNQRTHSNKTPSYPNLITLPKNRMSLADQPVPYNFGASTSMPQNRQKKATTEISADQHTHSIGPNSNHKNYNISQLNSCFCREVRLSRNNCVSKVVDFSFMPNSYRSPSPLPPRNVNFKSNDRIATEPKSHTLNKQYAREKKSQVGQERTPSFLKNIKKQSSLKPTETTIPPPQQVYPSSAKQINVRNRSGLNEEGAQRQSNFIPGSTQARTMQEGLMKMKVSDNQQGSSKKFQLCNRGPMGQSNANWQTSSNFHQRQLTSASPLNQSKCAFVPQSKNTSPLKFFAPVQIIAPTVYVNSNGNDNNSNIVLKLSELHENSPKLLRGQHQSPFSSKFQQNNNQSNLNPII